MYVKVECEYIIRRTVDRFTLVDEFTVITNKMYKPYDETFHLRQYITFLHQIATIPSIALWQHSCFLELIHFWCRFKINLELVNEQHFYIDANWTNSDSIQNWFTSTSWIKFESSIASYWIQNKFRTNSEQIQNQSKLNQLKSRQKLIQVF